MSQSTEVGMSFIYAIVFSIFSLLPLVAFAQTPNEIPNPFPPLTAEVPDDNHPVFKCNFPNEQSEPLLTTVIIDPEWSQVVTVSREGKLLPPATGLKLQLEFKNTNPVSYIWTMLNKKGEALIQLQELALDPPRYALLGRKPGTYDCYQQSSKNIEYYKRF